MMLFTGVVCLTSEMKQSLLPARSQAIVLTLHRLLQSLEWAWFLLLFQLAAWWLNLICACYTNLLKLQLTFAIDTSNTYSYANWLMCWTQQTCRTIWQSLLSTAPNILNTLLTLLVCVSTTTKASFLCLCCLDNLDVVTQCSFLVLNVSYVFHFYWLFHSNFDA